MKIAVISPNQLSLQEISKVLSSHTLSLVEGSKSQLRTVAEGNHDVILMDGMCHDLSELSSVEYVSTNYPRTAVVLSCPSHSSEFLIQAMRAGVREILINKQELLAAITRIEQRLGLIETRTGSVLAFMSAKGGDGSTFLATNFGHELALKNKKILLIDLNLQFGDALLSISDIKATTTFFDVVQNISRLDASFLAASVTKVLPNFDILTAAHDPSGASDVKAEELDAILNLAVTQYDHVLLDVPRELSELNIKAWDRADKLHVVLQPNLHSIRNAGKLLSTFNVLSYSPDKIELIVNRAETAGAIGKDDVLRSLQTKNVRFISSSYRDALQATNHGQPLSKAAPRSAAVKDISDWVLTALPKTKETMKSSFFKFLKRA